MPETPEYKPSLARYMAIVDYVDEKHHRQTEHLYDYNIMPLVNKVNSFKRDKTRVDATFYYFNVLGPLSAEWTQIDASEIAKLQQNASED